MNYTLRQLQGFLAVAELGSFTRAAERMRLTDRGVLKLGLWADIVIFDPETVRDLATFEKPNQLAEGMEYVLVNGVPVIDGGKMTNALPGKVLRGQGFEAGR